MERVLSGAPRAGGVPEKCEAERVVCPSIFDARNGGSGAAYWRAPLHGGRPRAALRVQPSCSRVCSPPAAAGSHAPRSLGDGRRVLALSSHLLSLASIARDGSPPWERTKAKQTGNALVGESAPSTGKRCGRAWLHPVNRTATQGCTLPPPAVERTATTERADAAPSPLDPIWSARHTHSAFGQGAILPLGC